MTANENEIRELNGTIEQPLTIIQAMYGEMGTPERTSDGRPLEPVMFGTTGAFRPAARWLDDQGVQISGHGGGFLFHDGVYYWYGENRTPGTDGGVRCYASRNLYDWKHEGVVLDRSRDASSPVGAGSIIERPKVLFCEKTGNFVMWFHNELQGKDYNSALAGTAVADNPRGPYRFIESLKPNGHDARDQTLFLDDDGTAYHIYSSEGNATLHISPLTEDFLKPSETVARAFPGRFYEAPAVFKHKGRYYLIASGCTGWDPNAARSAVADSILGPWTELGNPWRGPEEHTKISFHTQSTCVLPVHGKADAHIFMADRWNPHALHDSRSIWVPVEWEGEKPVLRWVDEWDLR